MRDSGRRGPSSGQASRSGYRLSGFDAIVSAAIEVRISVCLLAPVPSFEPQADRKRAAARLANNAIYSGDFDRVFSVVNVIIYIPKPGKGDVLPSGTLTAITSFFQTTQW